MKVSNNALVMLGGALVGALAGYLLFTNDGRAIRRRLEMSLDDANRELSNFRHTMGQAAAVATDGRQLLNEVISDGARQPMRYPSTRQTSPF